MTSAGRLGSVDGKQGTIRLVCLVEDTAEPPLRAEHGLSFLLSTDRWRVLFDTGQSPEVLLHNAEVLGEDLARLDAVVLSHGHYDHVGGLLGVLPAVGSIDVFAHPAVFDPRWSRTAAGGRRSIGPPWLGSPALQHARWKLDEDPVEVATGVWTTGQIPRHHRGEAIEDRLFVQADDREVPDRFPDDQALVLQLRDGVVVVCGCCHAGLVNTLEHVRRIWEEPIRAVVGGTHLAPLPVDAVDEAAAYLEQIGPPQILVGHCTGRAPYGRLAASLGAQVERLRAGTKKAW